MILIIAIDCLVTTTHCRQLFIQVFNLLIIGNCIQLHFPRYIPEVQNILGLPLAARSTLKNIFLGIFLLLLWLF